MASLIIEKHYRGKKCTIVSVCSDECNSDTNVASSYADSINTELDKYDCNFLPMVVSLEFSLSMELKINVFVTTLKKLNTRGDVSILVLLNESDDEIFFQKYFNDRIHQMNKIPITKDDGSISFPILDVSQIIFLPLFRKGFSGINSLSFVESLPIGVKKLYVFLFKTDISIEDFVSVPDETPINLNVRYVIVSPLSLKEEPRFTDYVHYRLKALPELDPSLNRFKVIKYEAKIPSSPYNSNSIYSDGLSELWNRRVIRYIRGGNHIRFLNGKKYNPNILSNYKNLTTWIEECPICFFYMPGNHAEKYLCCGYNVCSPCTRKIKDSNNKQIKCPQCRSFGPSRLLLWKYSDAYVIIDHFYHRFPESKCIVILDTKEWFMHYNRGFNDLRTAFPKFNFVRSAKKLYSLSMMDVDVCILVSKIFNNLHNEQLIINSLENLSVKQVTIVVPTFEVGVE